MAAVEDYCRQVEAYLCRKNDGHLIRIVGPAFEQVCGWAAKGVPLTVAMRGIDRYFERYYARGPRRRPVRIEFCEADVMDVFDEWRRALGITTADAAGSETPEPATVDDVPLVVLVSAFVTSELRTAFQIGFALFLPFIVIDVVVAAVLMSMGMMMLPPAMISLPFKILLFVLVDGWALIAQGLVTSFR